MVDTSVLYTHQHCDIPICDVQYSSGGQKTSAILLRLVESSGLIGLVIAVVDIG